jgi:hypothetical protein
VGRHPQSVRSPACTCGSMRQIVCNFDSDLASPCRSCRHEALLCHLPGHVPSRSWHCSPRVSRLLLFKHQAQLFCFVCLSFLDPGLLIHSFLEERLTWGSRWLLSRVLRWWWAPCCKTWSRLCWLSADQHMASAACTTETDIHVSNRAPDAMSTAGHTMAVYGCAQLKHAAVPHAVCYCSCSMRHAVQGHGSLQRGACSLKLAYKRSSQLQCISVRSLDATNPPWLRIACNIHTLLYMLYLHSMQRLWSQQHQPFEMHGCSHCLMC